jgi:sec-independent protein translocase protein TatA
MSIGFWQIIVILVVVLLLFGPKRLPELAKAVGRALHEFKKAKETLKKESEELIETAQTHAETQEKNEGS